MVPQVNLCPGGPDVTGGAGTSGFEPGLVLQHSRAPSRSSAEGLSVGGDGSALGAVWVPFGVAKIEEAQIRLFFSQCVGVSPLAPSVGIHVSPDDALAT
jgi:hypothetical protein